MLLKKPINTQSCRDEIHVHQNNKLHCITNGSPKNIMLEISSVASDIV